MFGSAHTNVLVVYNYDIRFDLSIINYDCLIYFIDLINMYLHILK